MRANRGWAGGRVWDGSAHRWFQSLAFKIYRCEGSFPHHYQAEKADLLTYFSLCSAVPSERRSRECSEDGGGGGGNGGWAGLREGMLVALGALYMPLPIPQAALPNGNTGTSEFLPSILKC